MRACLGFVSNTEIPQFSKGQDDVRAVRIGPFRYSFTKIHSGSNHYCILDISAACLQAGIPLQGDIMSYIVILFKVVYF